MSMLPYGIKYNKHLANTYIVVDIGVHASCLYNLKQVLVIFCSDILQSHEVITAKESRMG